MIRFQRRYEHVWGLALAVVFLAAHLPFLAPSLEDIDSLNFALALREFEPNLHQPHPPGYPIFVALGKLAHAAGLSESRALAIWGALLGAFALLALRQLFSAIEGVDQSRGGDARRPALATVLTAVCPLFWFTAVRPMSDMPGLALALVAQALFATAFWHQRMRSTGDPDRTSGRLIVLGSLVAALALGFRAQTIWLTAPALMLVIVHRIGRDAAGAILGASMAFAIGVMSWAIPMLLATSGLRAYVLGLGSQAAEDFSGVDMLVLTPTPRHLASALIQTLINPWGSSALGVVVITLVLVGSVVMALRARMGLLLLITLAVPYGAFHLLFQETLTTRYALPLIPAVCYLAVRGLSPLSRSTITFGVAALAVWALWIAVPAVTAYAQAPSPIFQAMRALEMAAASSRTKPVVGMHQVFARAMRVAEPAGIRVLPAPPKREWLELVRHWLNAPGEPVWFFADPMRTDLTLIDPTSRMIRETYRWPSGFETLTSGMRPASVDWIEFAQPSWFAAEGWALTPETAGIAKLDGRNPGRAPIVAYVRRQNEQPMTLLIGGRNLRPTGEGSALVTVTIDGRSVATVMTPPGFFVRILALPQIDASDPHPYARLEVSALPVEKGVPVDVAIEQFGVQAKGELAWGFDTGWHEPEFNPTTGRTWRWTSDRADTLVHQNGHDLTVTISGESPLRYFSRPATVVVRAGSQVVVRKALAEDFEFTARVPARALEAAQGRLTIETDEVFVPAEQSNSQDRRKLGLRIWKLEVKEELGGGRKS